MMSSHDALRTECPDLWKIDRHIWRLEKDIERGMFSAPALGYARLELADLQEEYKERRRRYLVDDPAILARYEQRKDALKQLLRGPIDCTSENPKRRALSFKMNLNVSGGTPSIDMSLSLGSDI